MAPLAAVEARVGEQPHVEHGVRAAQLPADERREDHQRAGEPGDRGGRRPAVPRGLDDGPDQQADARDRQQRAERVEPARLRVARLGQQPHPGGQRDDHDGHVDVEDRAPGEVPQQQAAGHRPDRDGQAGHARPDADGGGALARVGEHVREQRERGGVDQRGRDAHGRAAGDQLAGGAGQRGGDRREREQRQPGLQDPAPAEPVAEVPADDQQAGEDERVGVHDPLQVLGRGGQRAAHRRQGDVDDRVVDHDEQHAQAQDGQDPPAAAVGLGPGRGGGGHRNLPIERCTITM